MTDRPKPPTPRAPALPAPDAAHRFAEELLVRALDPEDPRNDAYYDWLARETRARQTPAERAATTREAAAFAARWRARHLAECARIALVAGAPPAARGRAVREAAPGDGARRRRTGPVPAYDDARAAAGFGREIRDEPCDGWIARPAGVPNGDYLALRVAGDSMTPLLHDADTILVRLGNELVPGTVVVARLPDDGYVVKQVARADRDVVELHSVNAGYPPLVVPRAELAPLGTVVLRWCAHG